MHSNIYCKGQSVGAVIDWPVMVEFSCYQDLRRSLSIKYLEKRTFSALSGIYRIVDDINSK